MSSTPDTANITRARFAQLPRSVVAALVVVALMVAALALPSLGTAAGAATVGYHIQDLSTPSTGGGSLTGISCTSAGNCAAVGTDMGSSTPLLAVESSGVWATPIDMSASGINGINCVSATNCTAVGSDSSGTPAFFTGDPSTWTSSTPDITIIADSATSMGDLLAVSCPSSTNCTAVGYDNFGDPIVLTGDPSTWNSTTTGTAVIADSTNSAGGFTGVSCTSATNCTAVGSDSASNPVVLTGDPSTWDSSTTGVMVSADASSAPGYINSVNCSSAASAVSCTAVGSDYNGNPFFITGNPSSWTVSTTGTQVVASSAGPDGQLNGVSCTSATNCTVVGYDGMNNPVVLTGDPSTWDSSTTGAEVTVNSTGDGGQFYAISCTDPTSCAIAGDNNSLGSDIPMVATSYIIPTEILTLNSGGGTVEAPINTLYGTPVTLPTPVFAHHTFSGWFSAPSGGTRETSPYTVDASLTLYAQWKLVTAAAVPVPRASLVTGYAAVGKTHTLSIIGTGFTTKSAVTSTEVGSKVRALRASNALLVVSVTVPRGKRPGRYSFVITTPSRKTVTISYRAK